MTQPATHVHPSVRGIMHPAPRKTNPLIITHMDPTVVPQGISAIEARLLADKADGIAYPDEHIAKIAYSAFKESLYGHGNEPGADVSPYSVNVSNLIGDVDGRFFATVSFPGLVRNDKSGNEEVKKKYLDTFLEFVPSSSLVLLSRESDPFGDSISRCEIRYKAGQTFADLGKELTVHVLRWRIPVRYGAPAISGRVIEIEATISEFYNTYMRFGSHREVAMAMDVSLHVALQAHRTARVKIHGQLESNSCTFEYAVSASAYKMISCKLVDMALNIHEVGEFKICKYTNVAECARHAINRIVQYTTPKPIPAPVPAFAALPPRVPIPAQPIKAVIKNQQAMKMATIAVPIPTTPKPALVMEYDHVAQMEQAAHSLKAEWMKKAAAAKEFKPSALIHIIAPVAAPLQVQKMFSPTSHQNKKPVHNHINQQGVQQQIRQLQHLQMSNSSGIDGINGSYPGGLYTGPMQHQIRQLQHLQMSNASGINGSYPGGLYTGPSGYQFQNQYPVQQQTQGYISEQMYYGQ